MKKKVFKFAALFISVALLTLSSCNKGDADSQSAEDAARGSYIMADAFAIANDGQGGKSLKAYSTGCDTIIVFEGGFDVVFDQCTGDDGIYRNGTLRVTAAADAWIDENSGGISIEYINFTQNDLGISGTVTAVVGVGNILGNGIDYIYFTLGANNLVVTYPDNDIATLNYAELNYVFKLTGVEIFGNSKGTNRNGVSYSSVSENIQFGTFGSPCAWPTEGTITVTIEGENDVIVNYDQDGNGTCDNIFLVSQKRHDDVTLTFE